MQITISIRIDECKPTHGPEAAFKAYLIGPLSIPKELKQMSTTPLAGTCPDNLCLLLTVANGLDAENNPVPFAGPLSCTPQDPTALSVFPGQDVNGAPVPNSFFLVPAQEAGHLGLTKVVLSDSAGSLEIDVTVIASGETTFGATLGTPQTIPAGLLTPATPVAPPAPGP